MPGNNNDLTTLYSELDEAWIVKVDTLRVNQVGTSQYLIHQYKNFVNVSSCEIQWVGQVTLAPTSSTVYMQIYNQNTHLWETIASDNVSLANFDFELHAKIGSLTNYRDVDNVISVRIYQLADGSSRILAVNFYQVLLPIAYTSNYSLKGTGYIELYAKKATQYIRNYLHGSEQDPN